MSKRRRKRKASPVLTLLKAVFAGAAGIFIFVLLTGLFQPKYYFATEAASPETEMWESFYGLEKNSLDVVFLGSSHVYNAIDPVAFEENTGLSAFDLASSNQDLSVSYFFVRELLRYQSPEYIVMDAYGFTLEPYEDARTYRRSFDNMHWSSVKREAIKAWLPHMEGETLLPRIFTLFDYHSRWDELTDEDFNGKAYQTSVRGFCPYEGSEKGETIDYQGFGKSDQTLMDISEENLTYFYKLVQLCEDNQIDLILIKTPDSQWTRGENQRIASLAAPLNMTYLDYNANQEMSRIGLDGSSDWRNSRHLNKTGAAKFTAVLAEDLSELMNH